MGLMCTRVCGHMSGCVVWVGGSVTVGVCGSVVCVQTCVHVCV